jgi:hypothetical protein
MMSVGPSRDCDYWHISQQPFPSTCRNLWPDNSRTFVSNQIATMAIITSVGISFVLAAGILHMTKRYLQNKHTLPLPPGPAGIPFLGNVNDMPKPGVPECHHWLQHKDLYGPISSVTVLGQTFIIMNDPEIAFELLRDRSAIHSSRPNQVFGGEM